MMTRYYVPFIILSVFVSCSRIELEEIGGGQTIMATIEGQTTKTSMGDYDESSGFYPVTWAKGDAINLYVEGTTCLFSLASGEGTQKGEFVGDLPTGGDNLPPYAAVYPNDKIESMADGFKVYATIPATQGYSPEARCSSGTLPMAAVGNSFVDLPFKMLGSVMRIPISRPAGETVNSIKITATNQKLAGDIVASLDRSNGDVSSISVDSNGESVTSITYTFGDSGYTFTGNETIFADVAVIPQKYSYGLTVNYYGKKGGSNIEYSHSTESPLVMKRGYVKEFSMLTDYVFTVTDIPYAFTYDAKVNGKPSSTEQTFYVSSYKYKVGTNQKEGLLWTLDYSEDDGQTWSDTKPVWLKQFSTTTGRRTSTYSGYVSVAANMDSVLVNAEHNEALKSASPVSGYDLSTNGGVSSVNTANMYLVNAPGTYKLPLVYGNAIKNGVENTLSYKASKEVKSKAENGKDIMCMEAVLQNHLGNDINSPYICSNKGVNLRDAILLWEDHEGLVKNVSIIGSSATTYYLTFEVPQGNIAEGNAVVGIRDTNGDVIWSWHIWVTDYHLGDDITLDCRASLTDPPLDVDVMKYDLGYVHDLYYMFESRSALVRFTQEETGAVAYVHVNQLEHFDEHSGWSMGYFYGSKEAIPQSMTQGETVVPVPVYNLAPGLIDRNGTTYTYAEAIKQPLTTHNYSGIASPEKKHNLWNINDYDYFSSKENVYQTGIDDFEKTIYDPSPVGYVVPSPMVFENIVESKLNCAARNVNYIEFYCRKMPSPSTVDDSGGQIRFYLNYPINASTRTPYNAYIGHHTNLFGMSKFGNSYSYGEFYLYMSVSCYLAILESMIKTSSVRSRKDH